MSDRTLVAFAPRALPGSALLAFALLVFSATASPAHEYGWSISASSTNASVSTASLPTGLPQNLFLWLGCTQNDGMSAAEFDLQANGLLPLSFTPMHGVLNAGTHTALLLAVGGCPPEYFVAGRFSVLNVGAGGDLCLVPSAANGSNVTLDCDAINPAAFDNAVHGFSTSGSSCCTGFCGFISVEPTSWAGVKALHR